MSLVSLVRFLGILLIALTAVLQAVGVFQPLESSIIHLLPKGFHPEAQHLVLLSLEKSDQRFAPLDVAMTLRGLSKYHPRVVIINGQTAPEQGSVPLLPNIFARLTNGTGINLIMPVPPGTEAHFQSIPLVSYDLSSLRNSWPVLEGKALPGIGNSYLPVEEERNKGLPLFAKTSEGASIGSLWWWGLPEQVRTHPPLILFRTILILANNASLQLTLSGEARSSDGGTFREMMLDDFLLEMEKKESGTISPSFDALWQNATVVLGVHEDFSKVSEYSTIIDSVSLRRPSLEIQGCMTLGLICLLLLASRLGSFLQRILAVILLGVLVSEAAYLLHQELLMPVLPGVLTALILLATSFSTTLQKSDDAHR